jgi:hypothetical protein
MNIHGFRIFDCALVAIATGVKAQTLRELRDKLKTAHPGCFFYHFWGGLLNPHFDDPEFQNDFAVWASRSLHDSRMSEKFAVIDPYAFENIEDVRQELIEVIEERLSQTEFVPWAKTGHEFYFIRSQMVVFDTGVTFFEPTEMLHAIPGMSLGSIFYHFIDARRRTEERKNDLSLWLAAFGDTHKKLIEDLDNIDPFFISLSRMRREITLAFNKHLKEDA